jgi:hypothetical protein
MALYKCTWNPGKFSSLTFSNSIIDPDNYLSMKDKEQIQLYIKSINKYVTYRTKLIILTEIDKTYQNSIEMFFNNTKVDLRNSICIFIVINSKIMKIRTQNEYNIKYVDCIESLICKELLNSLINKISQNTSLFKLLEDIVYRVQDLFKLIQYILFGLAISMGLLCCCLNRFKGNDAFQEKLEKIKEISANNSEGKYSSSMCVICYEGYKEYVEAYKAILDCGHSYHSTCIARWMGIQNKCPLCRKTIDREQEPINPLPDENNSFTHIFSYLDYALTDEFSRRDRERTTNRRNC